MKEKKRGKKKENLCYPRSMRFSSIIIIGCTPDKSVCGGACGMLSSLQPGNGGKGITLVGITVVRRP